MCCICQKCTTEPLKCPLDVNGTGDKSEPYSLFLHSVNMLRSLNSLPVALKFAQDICTSDLVHHKAMWYKSCHNKFSNDKIERATRKREKEETRDTDEYVVKRNKRQSMKKMACLFCQQDGGGLQLHEFKTLEADKTLRQMATDLQETELMARIEGGDLVALEAKYHLECLTALRNRHRSFKLQLGKESGECLKENQVKTRALVELLSYIENCIDEGVFCFKFSVLHQLYEQRIKTLGMERVINRTRLTLKDPKATVVALT